MNGEQYAYCTGVLTAVLFELESSDDAWTKDVIARARKTLKEKGIDLEGKE